MKRKTLKRKISIVGILVFVSMIVYSCWQDEWSSNVTDEVIFDSNKESVSYTHLTLPTKRRV